VKTVNVGYGLLPAIVGGSADAMLGGFRNVEGVDLRLRGKGPVVIPVDELGVPTYNELVLVAQRESLEDDEEAVRLFLAALARGTAAAAKSPDATTEALLAANPDLDPRLTRAEVAATLPLLKAPTEETAAAADGARPYGYMDDAEWGRFVLWMRERDNGQITSRPKASELLSNDYLPGRIP
jgi:putative hydroxymethylpyrimidine transport system substrate-binding protein